MKECNRTSFLKGLKDAIPIMLGYFAVSFTLGINASHNGLTWFQAGLMSFLNHTSAGQAAGIKMMAAGGTYSGIALSQLVINMRYLLMSTALALKLRSDTRIRERLLMSYIVSDEIFGISIAQKAPINAWYSIGAMAAASPGWVLGTIAGAVTGGALTESISGALAVALYAMFIAVIFPPMKQDKLLAAVVAVSMLASWMIDIIPRTSGVAYGMKVVALTIAVSAAFALIRPLPADKGVTDAA